MTSHTYRPGDKAPAPDAARVSWPDIGGVEVFTARFADSQRFSRHFHRRYGVGVMERGGMHFRFLGRDHTAEPGSVHLTTPGEMHDGHAAAQGGWAYRMLYLDPALVEDAASQAAGRPVAAPDFATGVIHDPELAARVRACHLLLDRGNAPRLARQTALIEMLAQWVARHADRRAAMPRAGGEPRGVALARAYMDAHFAEDVSLDDLARLANLSPFHFVRVFRRAVGAPPHAYLMNARLRAARALLATDLRLADIAQDTGFTDQAHLTNTFRRFTGLTPGRYRSFLRN